MEPRCDRHPANAAKYICPRCHAYACDTCGSHPGPGGKPKIFCPACGAAARLLAEFEMVPTERPAREDLNFYQRVKAVFKKPFGKS
ncbi:hypothetical protein LBMAG56_53680 [Verrucomicrobiota bacterium]|nr:hypothetical protein LBMAG56_53680 [Verrucomicrobiota bacterium]